MAEWYYTKHDRKIGPVSDTAIRHLVESGELTSNDFVWRPGFAEWVPASKVEGLMLPPPLPDSPSNDLTKPSVVPSEAKNRSETMPPQAPDTREPPPKSILPSVVKVCLALIVVFFALHMWSPAMETHFEEIIGYNFPSAIVALVAANFLASRRPYVPALASHKLLVFLGGWILGSVIILIVHLVLRAFSIPMTKLIEFGISLVGLLIAMDMLLRWRGPKCSNCTPVSRGVAK